ncbi:MAG: hypothetical protein ACTS7E_03990 [Arsenophonus sp. NC-CH8-MAG3]
MVLNNQLILSSKLKSKETNTIEEKMGLNELHQDIRKVPFS